MNGARTALYACCCGRRTFRADTAVRAPLLALLRLALIVSATSASAVDLDLARFATAKQNQLRDYAQTVTNKVPSMVWSFFDAVRVDDWETATNLAARIDRASGRYTNSAPDQSISPVLHTL